MVDFSKYKKSQTDLSRLAEEIDRLNNPGGSYEDDRFWKPTVDKSGNGMATIRFLPAPEVDGDDAMPWVTFYSHSFQGPTGLWFIKKCRTSLKGEKDPCTEYNSKVWKIAEDTNDETLKQTARQRSRKQYFVSNVLVIDDPANPDNNGKVKLFQYGKQIFGVIKSAMFPEFDDETPVKPFNLEDGANFKLKIRKVNDRRNYTKSGFDDPAPITDSDEELDRIMSSLQSLQDLITPDKFDSYDDLKTKLEEVLGIDFDAEMGQAPKTIASKAKPQGAKKPEPEEVVESSSEEGEEEDDDLLFFKGLANKD